MVLFVPTKIINIYIHIGGINFTILDIPTAQQRFGFFNLYYTMALPTH